MEPEGVFGGGLKTVLIEMETGNLKPELETKP
jgi:hypothetical protein